MARAIELARCGEPYAHPNPLVGAVIVNASGEILAEGYHRRCGEAHAEVNAVRMLDSKYPGIDTGNLTIYVSLEPCAHYGRTPPCAEMLARRGFGRVVIGTLDPFARVNGRGAAILRNSGAEVITGVMEKECRALNRRFFIAHTHRRPYIMLKWAQSADGYIDARRTVAHPGPYAFSSSLSRTLTHQLRTRFDAIAVGANTARCDRPQLDTRFWPGPVPRPVIFGNERCAEGLPLCDRQPVFIDGARTAEDLSVALAALYDSGIASLLVEGGAGLLQSFISAGLWDDLRIETSPIRLGAGGSVRAPEIPADATFKTVCILTGRRIAFYSNPQS